MKTLIGILSLTGLLLAGVSCHKNEVKKDVQQREEDIGVDDIRETDSYDRSVPVEEDEVDVERDMVRPSNVDLNKQNKP